ncbi:MAG: AAA family ATPase [Clostridiales bacterium]|nr:AAA family ATPase [Clostridiales bacterium]
MSQKKELKIISSTNVEVREINWLWYPFIPRGKVTILQGDPGEGKSTFMLTLAAYLTRGEALPFADCGEPPDPITVLYQSTEDDYDDTIVPRFIKAGGIRDRLAFIDESEYPLTFDDDRILEGIKQTGAKLLVLDPLASYIGDCSLNASNEVRQKFNALINAARETDCAIVVVNHMNKMPGLKAIYRTPGSIDVAGAVRSILLLARDPDEEDKRYLVQTKMNLASKGDALEFRIEDCGIKFTGITDKTADEILRKQDFVSGIGRPDVKLQEAKEVIEELLAAGAAVPAEDCEAVLKNNGVRRSTAQTAKRELGIESVRIQDRWYWKLPETDEG